MNYYFKTNRGPISIDIFSDELSKIKNAGMVVYTCNTNNYSPNNHYTDLSVYCKQNNYNYFVFTDRLVKDLDKSRQILFSYKAPDPRYAAKIFKIFPILFFDNAKYSLWIDANISFLKDLNLLINNFVSSENNFVLFKHNKRNNVIDESIECMKYGKDDSIIIKSQIQRYSKEIKNLERLGLYRGCVLLRKHTSSVNEMSNSWWNEISNGSIRDQLSLPIAIEKNSIRLSVERASNFKKYFTLGLHNKYKMYGIGNSIGSSLISFKAKLLYYLSKYLH